MHDIGGWSRNPKHNCSFAVALIEMLLRIDSRFDSIPSILGFSYQKLQVDTYNTSNLR